MLTQCPRCQALTNPTWQVCPVCQQDLRPQPTEVPSVSVVNNAPAALSHNVVPQETPAVVWRCRCCQSTRRWRSVYGAVVYVRCHPPADMVLVAGWEV